MSGYEQYETDGVPIKAWVRGVHVDENARRQLENVARLPIVHRWIAAMPDVHWGIGATVGSVIPTLAAIVPAAVGVDIGCGVRALRLDLDAARLPDDLRQVRSALERAVPHGFTHRGGPNDRGSWADVPAPAAEAWRRLAPGYERIVAEHPLLARGRTAQHLGTLGSGNHFIELCVDGDQRVWVLLHTGSRGPGNRIGQHFISLAKEDMEAELEALPDRDLAYLRAGSPHFEQYVHAVGWAQDFARMNRMLVVEALLEALVRLEGFPPFEVEHAVIDCHHNYVQRERHYGRAVFVTRKGAVRAGAGELGIIPGSMGARSFIVRGKGNPESFHSCSHGAGRMLSRTEARRRFGLDEHAAATAGIECRKDAGVLDETPMAYKPIDAVMAAQRDLVEVVHELRQILCIKG